MTMNSPAMLFAACAIVVGFSVITLGPRVTGGVQAFINPIAIK